MNLNIKSKNLELTEAIRDYVDKRLDGIDKFKKQDEAISVFVEVGKTTNHHKRGDVYRAEFNVAIGGKKFYTFSEKEDLYSSIDEAKDDLFRKIKNNRERRNTLFKRGAIKIKGILKGLYQKN